MATTTDAEESEDAKRLERLNANVARMEALTQRMTAALARRKQADPALAGPSGDVYLRAAAAYVAEMMRDPGRIVEQQVGYWGKTLKLYADAQRALLDGDLKAPPDTAPKDRRFANPLWETHPFFNYVKQQYLTNAEAISTAMGSLSGLTPAEAKRVDYFSKQIVDMFAPTNFLGTNPDALEKAVATDGESLVAGLTNLVRDIEASGGDLQVTLADPDAFRLGENIAASPGGVVYRNRLMELIQYAPATEKVHRIPVLIFPPWINKFYVLDLTPQNSLIAWLVEQGFTVFVASWVNPDASYADTGMDDYIRDGFMRGLAEVRRICGVREVNAVGYCIAGTTLSATLAHLAKAGDASVKSATFFTTLTDFSDQGEVGVFLDDDFVDGIDRQTAVDGVLDRSFMARTFSFLRSNDLIWKPAIRSYMMGEAPPAFDLLYWNGDGTNLPRRMAMEYLRGLCQDDGLAKGAFEVLGAPVSLSDIRVPVFAVACETDHIAAWRSSYAGIARFGSKDKRFTLSQSGHIAGIVNPPSKGKYGHYVNDGATGPAEAFLAGAEFRKGSWWPRWGAWLEERSGRRVVARTVGTEEAPVLASAPGTYVSM